MPKILILLFLILLNVTPAIAVADWGNSNDEPMEVFLGFRYQGGVNTTIVGFVQNDTYFLPVLDLFRILLINNVVDESGKVVTGFYVRPNNRYEINFNTYSIHYQGRRISLDTYQIH